VNPAHRLVPLAAAIALFALTLALGDWQLRRADEKLALQAQWDSAVQAVAVEVTGAQFAEVAQRLPLRVSLRGRFLADYEVWLDTRLQDGRSGLMLVTPLRLADGAVVLVNRGFAARTSSDRSRLPEVLRPADEVTVEGLAVARTSRVLALGEDAPAGAGRPLVWQNLDFDAYERVSGLAVARWVVQQTGGDADGLARSWPRLAAGVDKHHGYALQWFSLAALVAALTVFFGVRALRRRPEPRPDD
jgi:cytochrome oxidase assembly protein ShyY1